MTNPTWDETEPLFDDTEPAVEKSRLQSTSDSLKNLGKAIAGLPGLKEASDVVSKTPMGTIASGMDVAQKGADYTGEKLAEGLTRAGVDPTLAAGAGTMTQMIPDIAASMTPMTGAPKPSSPSPAAKSMSNIATDARIRGFRVPGSAIDKAGELEGMRKSVEVLKGQGIEPKIMESAEDLAGRVKSGIGEYGQAVRGIPEALDKRGIKPRLNEETLPRFLESELQPQYSGGAYDAEAAVAREIAETAKGHSGSFKELLDLKQKFGEQGRFYRVNTGEPGAPLKAEMYQKAFGKVNDILKNEIDALAPQLSEAWAQANKIYSAGKDVLPHLTTEAGKAAARSISDIQGLSKAASRKIISPATAYGADKLAGLLESMPQAFGRFTNSLKDAASKGQLAATNYVLQQRDPEYAELLKKLQEEDQNEE